MRKTIKITEHQFGLIVESLSKDGGLINESVYRVGSKGKEVQKIQKKLGLNPDGDFGKSTHQAVVKFQKKNGLTPDGVVGPSTLELLFPDNNVNVKQSTEYPYKQLSQNPKSSFIAEIIKKSKGSSWYKNDKESWAESAFNVIKSPSVYNEVSKILGRDVYSFIESFMDTKEMYHVNPIYSHYIKLFPGLTPTNCTPDVLKTNNWSGLYKILVKRGMMNNGDPLIIIWGPTQTLYYTTDGKSVSISSKVSTGKDGFGNVPDQPRTSTGLLRVKGKVKADDYEVLVGKTPTGTILGPNKNSNRVDSEGTRHIAEVLTGILELDGMESCNLNTFSRNIYIHGTNKESLLGSKRSNGCVRVPNNIIKQLLNTVKVGTKVYIYPDY